MQSARNSGFSDQRYLRFLNGERGSVDGKPRRHRRATQAADHKDEARLIMASVYKRKRDKANTLASWYIACADADGIRRTVKGCTDRAATEQMARKLETEAELRRRGLIDPRDEQFAADEAVPLGEHLEAWRLFSLSVNNGERHANQGFARVRNLMAMAKATRLSDLSLARMQAAAQRAEEQESITSDNPPSRLAGQELCEMGLA